MTNAQLLLASTLQLQFSAPAVSEECLVSAQERIPSFLNLKRTHHAKAALHSIARSDCDALMKCCFWTQERFEPRFGKFMMS